MTPRSIPMPGPPSAERVVAVRAAALPIDAMLPAGPRLLDALAALMQAHNVESACLTLSGGALGPFAYVIPALSPDATHAAFYSDTFRPADHTSLEIGAVTLGFRDGSPFFHCHALWTEAGGRRGCGHILPDDTVIAAPIRVRGAGLVGARFDVTPDPETGFNLFMPRATGTMPPPGAHDAVAFRLAPNQQLTAALDRLAIQAGFRRATLQGGVASIIGARFVDAPDIEGFATELLVRRCEVRGSEGPETEIDVVIVDFHGTIGAGRLVNGDNPVLMTFEGVLLAA